MSTVDPDASAVNPAFRTAITDLALSPTQNTTSNLTAIQATRQLVHDQISPIRGFAPEGGQYLNEVRS